MVVTLPEPKPNIHQRKNAIVKELGGALLKTGQMTEGGSYDFHTVDAVHDALRPLFVKHGVSFVCSLCPWPRPMRLCDTSTKGHGSG